MSTDVHIACKNHCAATVSSSVSPTLLNEQAFIARLHFWTHLGAKAKGTRLANARNSKHTKITVGTIQRCLNTRATLSFRRSKCAQDNCNLDFVAHDWNTWNCRRCKVGNPGRAHNNHRQKYVRSSRSASVAKATSLSCPSEAFEPPRHPDWRAAQLANFGLEQM